MKIKLCKCGELVILKDLVMVNKVNELNIGDTFRFKNGITRVVSDIHGYYDEHSDKLKLSELISRYYTDDIVFKVVGVDKIHRRGIANTDKEVFVVKVDRLRTSLNQFKRKGKFLIRLLKSFEFYIALALLTCGYFLVYEFIKGLGL